MNDKIIRVAIVDDQKLFRKGLRLILDNSPHIEVAFEAEHGQDFFKKVAFEPVDVVILDVEMPVLDGARTLERIRKEKIPAKVLILTMHDNDRLIAQFMETGADGFLLKDEEPGVVCMAVRTVVTEGVFFRDYVSNALLKKNRRRSESDREGLRVMSQLSERELQILHLLCKEYTSKEIGTKLFISSRTVEGHRRQMQQKVGARNLAGLVMYAVNNGLV